MIFNIFSLITLLLVRGTLATLTVVESYPATVANTSVTTYEVELELKSHCSSYVWKIKT